MLNPLVPDVRANYGRACDSHISHHYDEAHQKKYVFLSSFVSQFIDVKPRQDSGHRILPRIIFQTSCRQIHGPVCQGLIYLLIMVWCILYKRMKSMILKTFNGLSAHPVRLGFFMFILLGVRSMKT